jgi:pimeloyl-ACP methyl ester carboxylesterase
MMILENTGLYFLSEKKKQTIVLVHGFGEDGSIWKHQIKYLQNNFQVCVPHLRGSGTSVLGTKPLSIEAMAEDLKEMLEKENITKCIMLGHSMGGYITLAFTEKYPETLEAFGLIHSSAYADSEEKKEARNKSIEFVKQKGPFELMKTVVPNLFSENFKEKNKDVVENLVEKNKQFSAEAIIGYTNAMMNRPDRTEVLKNTTVPVLFFIGEEDKAVNPKDAIKQSTLPAICSVKIVPGIAHMGMLESTEILNESISEFVSAVHLLKKQTAHL